MKIISIICLLILFVLTGCLKYIGISKKQATQNLKSYLDREYHGSLTFSHLNRFFNAASMDPNIFSVLIFNKQIPEIEFYTHINVKNILENDTLPLYPREESITIDHLYKDAVKRYDTRQVIIADFKKDIPEITFTVDIISLNFKEGLDADVLEAVLKRFINRLNQSYDDLNSAFEFSLLIKTPVYPEGFINIPLESEDGKWYARPFMLSENITNFEAFKAKIETSIQTKLDVSYPNFKINDYRKLYVDKRSLSKGAWVQYLDDKSVHNTPNGKWENPQKGVYIVYFDLQTQFIYRGEMLTEENYKTSYDEEIIQIYDAITAEGLQVN